MALNHLREQHAQYSADECAICEYGEGHGANPGNGPTGSARSWLGPTNLQSDQHLTWQVNPCIRPAQPRQRHDRACRFVSSRGHVTELQMHSVVDQLLTVEASFALA
jgi:hypothetical protein